MSQAVDKFIESSGLSRDFTTAYAHSLRIAQKIWETDPDAARDILERLDKARPEQPRARELLQRFFD
ncbi:MAG: hypothetical protein GTO60_11195 [Gammaproteobacteria bacterium]|nr:hypothetical protein [Gammaproteobacteria bacterium]